MKITKLSIITACLAACLSVGSVNLTGTALSKGSPVNSVDGGIGEASIKPVEKSGYVKKAAVGETFKITLEENTSTGHSWSYVGNSDALELIADKIEYPEQTDSPMVGVANLKTWTFKATKAGTYTLKFVYTQPWEKDQKPAQTETYTINVTEKGKSGQKTVKQQPLAVLKTGKMNTVKAGQAFYIQLEENTTTGYNWSYKVSNTAVNLIAEENRFPAQVNLEGAPNEKIWTFKATKAGTYTLKFNYMQSWEEEQQPAQSMIYTIKVN